MTISNHRHLAKQEEAVAGDSPRKQVEPNDPLEITPPFGESLPTTMLGWW
jgi:hypothetical protein